MLLSPHVAGPHPLSGGLGCVSVGSCPSVWLDGAYRADPGAGSESQVGTSSQRDMALPIWPTREKSWSITGLA